MCGMNYRDKKNVSMKYKDKTLTRNDNRSGLRRLRFM